MTAALRMPDTEDDYTTEIPRGSTRSRYALVAAVCERIAGGELVQDAAVAEGITAKSVRQWTEASSVLGAMYARARIDQAHTLAEDVVRLSDEPVETTEQAARQRLRVDTRKWFVAKIAPKLYGDDKHHTVDISVSGMYLQALKASAVQPAQLTAGDEIVVDALPDDTDDPAE